jgi:hypothetical protein
MFQFLTVFDLYSFVGQVSFVGQLKKSKFEFEERRSQLCYLRKILRECERGIDGQLLVGAEGRLRSQPAPKIFSSLSLSLRWQQVKEKNG